MLFDDVVDLVLGISNVFVFRKGDKEKWVALIQLSR